MPALFDPLVWLHSKGAEALLAAEGRIELRFDSYTPRPTRERIRRVVAPYEVLLRLQLNMPKGVRPRTVQQLIASGRLRVSGGCYEVEGRPPMDPYRRKG